jgi:hypothetical protein
MLAEKHLASRASRLHASGWSSGCSASRSTIARPPLDGKSGRAAQQRAAPRAVQQTGSPARSTVPASRRGRAYNATVARTSRRPLTTRSDQEASCSTICRPRPEGRRSSALSAAGEELLRTGSRTQIRMQRGRSANSTAILSPGRLPCLIALATNSLATSSASDLWLLRTPRASSNCASRRRATDTERASAASEAWASTVEASLDTSPTQRASYRW